MNRIRDLRIERGWTQAQVGKKIGAARNTISMYEAEKRQLDPATICALCNLFGCSADYLLCRSDTPQPALSDEDARILRAYRDADPRDRAFIDHLLGLDLQDVAQIS